MRDPVTIEISTATKAIYENSQVTFVATISNQKATGNIDFDIEIAGRAGSKARACPAIKLSAQATATCTLAITDNLEASEFYYLTASYSGDANYLGAGATSLFTVQKKEISIPCVPKLGQVEIGDSYAKVSIDPVVRSSCGIATSFEIRDYYSEKTICETNSRSCTLTNLTNGIETAFYILAVNSKGNSGENIRYTKQLVTSIGKPPKPNFPTATVLNTSKIRVSWTGRSDGGSPLKAYEVYSNDGILECTNLLYSQIEKDTNQYSCDVDNPIRGQSYSFTLRAINKFGSSVPSNPTTAITITGTEIEKFQHRISVKDGFDVLSIKLTEVGNYENQRVCSRSSSCSIIVPKGGKWDYVIEDAFANTITDGSENMLSAEGSGLISSADTDWVINSDQEKALVISTRKNTQVPLGDKEKENVVRVDLQLNEFAIISPLFTTKKVPTQVTQPNLTLPDGMFFSNGTYFGIPTKKGFWAEKYTVDGVDYSLAIIVSQFKYASPDSISIAANGTEVSYDIKPSSSNLLSDKSNSPQKWEVQFFNASTNSFISKVCTKTLTGRVEVGIFSGVYAKAYSGCTDMKEPEFKDYRISAATDQSNTVATKIAVKYSGKSANDPIVTSDLVDETLSLSFQVQPGKSITLVPSVPLALTAQDRANFSNSVPGFAITATGEISGAVMPSEKTYLVDQSWKKTFNSANLNINLDVTIILPKLISGMVTGIKVVNAAAKPVGSIGDVTFDFKPEHTGTYKFTLELVAKYRYIAEFDRRTDKPSDAKNTSDYSEAIVLGTSSATYNSLAASAVKVDFTSNKIVLPGFVNDESQGGIHPYELSRKGVSLSYRMRVDTISVSEASKTYYLKSSATSFQNNLALVWNKPIAPKPPVPKVSETSNSGELQVTGLIATLWNYPTMPKSLTLFICNVKARNSCRGETFTSFSQNGALVVKKLSNAEYKIQIIYDIDPDNPDLQTGRASDFSKAVKPKK
jgi:hypothetical protein